MISHLHMLSVLIKNFHKMVHKQFFTITWQNSFFFAWIDWSHAFNFRICFGKTLIASDFDKKTYTKRCTSNYVISRVKRLSSPALCGWSGAFNFRVWFGKRNVAVKIVAGILILLLFCLLCWLKNHLFCVLSLL